MLLKLLWSQLKVRFRQRGDFLVAAGADLALASTGFLLLKALYSQVNSLSGFGEQQALFCWGFAETVVGVFFVLFGGLYQLNHRYILGGELDRVLLKPVDPLLHILIENIGPEHLPILLLGIGVMHLSGIELESIGLFVLMLIGAAAVLGGLLTGLSALGFHLHHRGTAVGLVFQLGSFGRYPLDVFPGGLKFLLTWVIPLGFAGFYPASFLMEGGLGGWTPVIGGVCLGLGVGFWRWSLGRYGSGGG
jgi:ABC-2 type transport system permease protein